ncbi:MAG: plasmid pRiA4b ORF-3 family protein [Phormidesmis sp.]
MPEAYRLKVTLVDSEPEVWRVVLVSTDLLFSELHDVVQRAMGWQNQHDYVFRLEIGQAACETQQSLAAAIASCPDQTLYYTYDLKNGWLHRLEAQAATADRQTALPICIDGAAACPPEGSGGVWGYDELLERLEDPEDPDYLDLIEKYGDFDAEAFDLAAVNARLAKGG